MNCLKSGIGIKHPAWNLEHLKAIKGSWLEWVSSNLLVLNKLQNGSQCGGIRLARFIKSNDLLKGLHQTKCFGMFYSFTWPEVVPII